MSAEEAPQCHYAILGVDRKVDIDEIRKSYRKLALKYHPDRNVGNEEQAAEQFKLIQEAYEVLSDPQDRSYYDANREKILRGKMGGDEDLSDGVELFPYFGSSCFKGYDDSTNGFYSVYAKIFAEIARLEKEDLGIIDDDEEENVEVSSTVNASTAASYSKASKPSPSSFDDIDDYVPRGSCIDDIDDYVPSEGGIDDIDDYVPSTGGIDDIDDYIPSSAGINDIDDDYPTPSTASKENESTENPQNTKSQGATSRKTSLFPTFGTKNSFNHAGGPAELKRFYSFWSNFSSRRSFSWHNRWDLRESENRKIKKLMEEENRRLRTPARLAFNDKVRRLASFVMKKDPRMLQIRLREMEEKEKRIQAEEDRKAKLALEKKKNREAFLALEAIRLAEQEKQHKATYGEDDDDDDYYGKKGKKGKNKNKDWVEEVYECEACAKSFKSENQWQQHLSNAKHKKIYAEWQHKLREQLLKDEAEMMALMASKQQASSTKPNISQKSVPVAHSKTVNSKTPHNVGPVASSSPKSTVPFKGTSEHSQKSTKTEDTQSLEKKLHKLTITPQPLKAKNKGKNRKYESDEENEYENVVLSDQDQEASDDSDEDDMLMALYAMKSKSTPAKSASAKSTPKTAREVEIVEADEDEDEYEDEYEDVYEDEYEDVYEDEYEDVYEDEYEDIYEDEYEDVEEDQLEEDSESDQSGHSVVSPPPLVDTKLPKLNKTQLRKLARQQEAAAAIDEKRKTENDKMSAKKKQQELEKAKRIDAYKTKLKASLGMAVSAKALRRATNLETESKTKSKKK